MLRMRSRHSSQVEQYPFTRTVQIDENVVVFQGVPKVRRSQRFDGMQVYDRLTTPHLPGTALDLTWRNRLFRPTNSSCINPFGPEVRKPKKRTDNLFNVALNVSTQVLRDLWEAEGQYDPVYVDLATQQPNQKLMEDDLANKLSRDLKLIVTAGGEPFLGESYSTGLPLVYNHFYGVSDLFSEAAPEPALLYVPDSLDRGLLAARFILDNRGHEHGEPDPPAHLLPVSPLTGVAV
ncbi:MAG TPA: hypothetical protein VM124_02535 [Candidatus Limnocylindrales bacterium]|nr:hypothetical protein [Candidatus Limnocylindrales bacterium]